MLWQVVSFERWLLVQQQKAGPNNPDPLLPDLGGEKEPDQLLLAELKEAGAGKKESKRLVNYLGELRPQRQSQPPTLRGQSHCCDDVAIMGVALWQPNLLLVQYVSYSGSSHRENTPLWEVVKVGEAWT